MPPAKQPLLLTLILMGLAGGCALRDRALRHHLTPARLDREVLTLKFYPRRIDVTARFAFRRKGETTWITCMFPDAGYPVTSGRGGGPHPPVSAFRVNDTAGPLPITRNPDKNRVEFPARFDRRSHFTIHYSAPWQKNGNHTIFRYVLKTGGWWKDGTIGSLRIVVINKTGHTLSFSKPYDSQRVFRNFRPQYDIDVIK